MTRAGLGEGLSILFGYVKPLIRAHLGIVIILGAGLIIGLALVPAYRFQINPDGIAYIGIAEKYSHANFGDAINGYWSPLLSWLIAPVFWLHKNPIAGIKVLNVVVSAGIVLTVYALVWRQSGWRWLAGLAAAVASVFSLEMALPGPLTPDLIVCWLSLVLLYLFTSQFRRPRLQYALIGLCGALLYFSKSVGFFLFVGMWLFWLAASFFYPKRPKVWRSWLSQQKPKLLALVVFTVLIAPFVLLISFKYDRPTLGTAGAYNFSVVGPQASGHPIENRLIAPPNKTAVTAWEDISRQPIKNWNPLASFHNLKHFYQNGRSNLTVFNVILQSSLWPLTLLALLFVFTPTKNPQTKRFKFLVLTIGLLTLVPYIPVFMEQRYVMYIIVASIIGASCLIAELQIRKSSAWLAVFFIVLCLLVCSKPLQHIKNSRHMNRDISQSANALKKYISPKDRVASDDFASIYMCYYTGAKCYGVVKSSQANGQQLLKQYGITNIMLLPTSLPNYQAAGYPLQKMDGATFLDWQLYKLTDNNE